MGVEIDQYQFHRAESSCKVGGGVLGEIGNCNLICIESRSGYLRPGYYWRGKSFLAIKVLNEEETLL